MNTYPEWLKQASEEICNEQTLDIEKVIRIIIRNVKLALETKGSLEV